MDGVSEETRDAAFATMRAWYRRVRSVVDVMAGDLERGYDDAMAAIEAEPEGMNSQISVWCAGRAALWMGDVSKARAAFVVRRHRGGRGWPPTSRAIEAGIAALEGSPREAAAVYDNVLAGRLAQGDPFAHALATADAAAVLPADLVPEGALAAARTYLEGLGAGALLARLSAADATTP